MASFTVKAVEPLDYDFTGFPQDKDNKKMCTGKGTVPEPTQNHLTTYSECLKDLYQVDTAEELTEKVKQQKPTSAEAKKENEAKLSKIAGLTAALCQGSPSKAELQQLTPRIRTAFMKWIYQELANPEVSSAATPT